MFRKLSFCAVILAIIAAGSLVLEAQSVRVKGEVAGINHANQTILITTEKGFVTVRVDGMTEMKRNKQFAFLNEIEIGEGLDVNYESSSMTAQTVVITRPYVEGFITAIPTQSNTIPVQQKVTITPFQGRPLTLEVRTNTRIKKDEQPATFGDLEVGDYAKAYYEVRTKVATTISAFSTVSVTGIGTISYKGVIVGVRPQPTSGTNPVLKIALKPLVGRTTMTFLVNSQTVVKVNGNPATMNDIRTGDVGDVRVSAGSVEALQVLITRNTPQGGSIEGEFSSEK